MNNISIYHLSEDIRSEFTIDEQGRAFASRRAVARLVGVEHPSILKLLKRIASGNLKKSPSLQPFAGQDFSDGKLPDILVAAIIEYYCFDSRAANRQAQLVYRAFATVGFRLWVQQELGWHKPLSQAEYLLSVAQQFVEQERQLKLIGSQINTVESQVEVLAAQTEEIKKTQSSQDEVLLSLVAIQKQYPKRLLPYCTILRPSVSQHSPIIINNTGLSC